MHAGFWKGKHVLVTGHTGFKGGWLALWLTRMGAEVTGVALPPATNPSFFHTLNVSDPIHHIEADIRDGANLHAIFARVQPEIVLHLAAQSLVRYSYNAPVETYETNVMGTINVLEAVRNCPSVKATLIVTTDKCYENVEQIWSYREHDRMGGHDPYSNSKACAELVTEAYTRSFFLPNPKLGAVASARAGNVIGGGDWALDRLVPDLVRGLMDGKAPILRNPTAIRPWQHVLEPLGGYLTLVESIYGKTQDAPIAYNFGPEPSEQMDVGTLAHEFCRIWDKGITPKIEQDKNAPHEAHLLTLDITKARKKLGWRPQWNMAQTLAETALWYKAFAEEQDITRVTFDQIDRYTALLEQ